MKPILLQVLHIRVYAQHSPKEVPINCFKNNVVFANSEGKITSLCKSNISTGISFLDFSIVREKFRLTVLKIMLCLQNSLVKITPHNKCNIPTGITFLRVRSVRWKFRLTLFLLCLNLRLLNS